jgi:hypothetical protein
VPEQLVAALSDAGVLPPDTRAVFVGGSVARGWHNALSDIDAYVMTAEPWSSPSAWRMPMELDPPVIAMELVHLGGVPVDAKYWTEGQYARVLAKLAATDPGPSPLLRMADEEKLLLERIRHPLICCGEQWMRQAQAELAASPHRRLVVTLSFDMVDARVDDALGQLSAGDVHSAVLSVRLAHGHAIDGLLASHGEVGTQPKWRARRLAEVKPPELPYDDYWRVETMADYDPADPAGWVRRIARECRRITTVVDAG